MNKPKNQFPLKIILSYLVLGALAVVVSYFLYSEYQAYISDTSNNPETEKIIETGTLINDVYETDSFSRIALLTYKQVDFDNYLAKSDSLYHKIDELRSLIPDTLQKQQLDSVVVLLKQKTENIEQLKILKITSEQDTSLDDILREFKKFDSATGRLTVEGMFRDPSKLSKAQRRAWAKWADYLTKSHATMDTVKVKSLTIDSLLSVSKYIVMEAKRENSRTRKALKEREEALLENELNISVQLRKMISDFEAEINKKRIAEIAQIETSKARARKILLIAGIAGFIAILFFSYLLVTDFFKAEKFKKNLQRAKRYSEELLKSRDQLMATVSHDLKTPLNTIVGYSELFTHTPLSDKQKTYSQQITSSAHFISKMVDDLLDFSKLEAGKLPIDHIPFSLENLLHQIAKAAKDLHIEKPINLTLYIDESLEGKIFESDPLRIQQIIHNLVSNAYKFTEKGRIQITANLLKAKTESYKVEIAVTDSGIGISEEKQQLIFKEFTQAESDTFQKFGGSGLGLAISKKIAALLKGTLKVKSTLGEGSSFFLTIPLKISKLGSIPVPPPAQLLTIHDTITALVIDDDPSMLKLLKELFAQMNIEAKTYTDYQMLLNDEPLDFDIVLTDIEMPVYSGFQILASLMAGDLNSYNKQPVIAMTGARKFPKKEYLQAGFSDLLQKPFSKNQLIAALNPLFLNELTTHLPELAIYKNSSNEVFDLAFLESFLSSQESINEVLAIFYEQTEKDMEHIEQAIKNCDCELMESISHRMLTMCRQLSAKRVNPILETMEQCAKEKATAADMEMLYANLKIEIRTLIEALQKREEITI